MPLDFSSFSSNDAVTNQIAAPAIGANILYFGWYNIATLTGGRTLWGFGNAVTKAQLSSASADRVRLTLQRATTDRVVDFQSAGLAANVWQWIGILVRSTGTSWNQTYCWVGRTTFPPVVSTETAITSGAGNANSTGSGDYCIGNTDSASSAGLQGEVSHVGSVYDARTGVENLFGFPSSDAGGLTTIQLDGITKRICEPLWRGDYSYVLPGGQIYNQNWLSSSSSIGARMFEMEGDTGQMMATAPQGRRDGNALTVTGATKTLNHLGRPFIDANQPTLVRAHCRRRPIHPTRH